MVLLFFLSYSDLCATCLFFSPFLSLSAHPHQLRLPTFSLRSPSRARACTGSLIFYGGGDDDDVPVHTLSLFYYSSSSSRGRQTKKRSR